jgi:hypothetical protein
MIMIGYARVSTLNQDLSLQLAAGIAAAKARGSIRGDRPRSMLKLSNASAMRVWGQRRSPSAAGLGERAIGSRVHGPQTTTKTKRRLIVIPRIRARAPPCHRSAASS